MSLIALEEMLAAVKEKEQEVSARLALAQQERFHLGMQNKYLRATQALAPPRRSLLQRLGLRQDKRELRIEAFDRLDQSLDSLKQAASELSKCRQEIERSLEEQQAAELNVRVSRCPRHRLSALGA
jgi:regulator of replication initiation timing